MPINYFETSFEARERRAQIENLYHGETVDLVAVVTTDGVPRSLEGYTATGVYQPTSMHGSEDFYQLSADIENNRIIVHWASGSDFGEDSYMVWVLVSKEGDAAYPITWRLDMAYSPNFPLSDVVPIPKAIDFSKYELLNAPWLELSAAQDLPYLPLSGGTVEGDFAVKNFISADSKTVQFGLDNSTADDAWNYGAGIIVGNGNSHYRASSFEGKAIDIGFGNSLSNTGNAIVVGSNNKSEGAEGSFKTASTIIGSNNYTHGAFHQIVVGNSVSASNGGSMIGIGYYASVGSDSVAVVNGGNYTKATVGNSSVGIGAGVSSVADNSIAIGRKATTTQHHTIQLGEGSADEPYQFNVFGKNVLSGTNYTLNPERIPYLTGYAKTEDLTAYATKEEVNALSDEFDEKGAATTAEQNAKNYADEKVADLSSVYETIEDASTHATKSELQEVDAKFAEYIPNEMSNDFAQKTDLEEYTKTVDLSVYAEKTDLTGYATKGEISDFITEEALTGFATEEELTAYAQLSDLENIDVPEISACLSSDEFADVEELGAAETVSFQDLVDKVNLVIQKLKRTWKDPRYTWVTYTDDTIKGYLIEGTLDQNSNLGDRSTIKELDIGKAVNKLGLYALINTINVSTVVLPDTVTTIHRFAMLSMGRPLQTSVIFENRTMTEVQNISDYSWSASGNINFICTDGTITR